MERKQLSFCPVSRLRMTGGGVRESLSQRLKRPSSRSRGASRPLRRLGGTAVHCGAAGRPPPGPGSFCAARPRRSPRSHTPPRACPRSPRPARGRRRTSILREPLTHTRALPDGDSAASRTPPSPPPAGPHCITLTLAASDASALHRPPPPPPPPRLGRPGGTSARVTQPLLRPRAPGAAGPCATPRLWAEASAAGCPPAPGKFITVFVVLVRPAQAAPSARWRKVSPVLEPEAGGGGGRQKGSVRGGDRLHRPSQHLKSRRPSLFTGGGLSPRSFTPAELPRRAGRSRCS